MDLNNQHLFPQIDRQNYLAEIESLPGQLEKAYQLSLQLELPAWQGIERVVIAGMGGSAIGADLLRATISPTCTVPVEVVRNYSLPVWAMGKETMVVASSHSGNTEETLAAFEQALHNRCRVLSLCTGGKLAERARATRTPVWIFTHAGQPRAAVGYSFGMLLGLFYRLRLIPDPAKDLSGALTAMRKQQESLQAELPVVRNLAKREAGQLMGRWVMIFGADVLEPVARRWKTQLNELAKTWAQFEALPEANHNALAGLTQPEQGLASGMALFLRGSSNHPRNLLRIDLTKQAYMLEGLNTDFYDAPGETALAQQWTALHFGDYLAYYLALLYNIDPTPIEALVGFKQHMAEG